MGLKAGWPDLIGCYRGRFFGIELKTKKGRPSPAQKEAHMAIITAGGVVTVCRSVEEVRAFLDTLGVASREARRAA